MRMAAVMVISVSLEVYSGWHLR